MHRPTIQAYGIIQKYILNHMAVLCYHLIAVLTHILHKVFFRWWLYWIFNRSLTVPIHSFAPFVVRYRGYGNVGIWGCVRYLITLLHDQHWDTTFIKPLKFHELTTFDLTNKFSIPFQKHFLKWDWQDIDFQFAWICNYCWKEKNISVSIPSTW